MFFSYVRSRATGDLNDFARLHRQLPERDHSSQPGRHAADGPAEPFRRLGIAPVAAGFRRCAPVLEYRNGFPYSAVNEQQRYVGVPNSKRFPNFLSADARVWRDFKVNAKYSVRLSVSGFNLTNHFNPEATHWNTADSAYGLFFGERHRRFTADFDVLF